VLFYATARAGLVFVPLNWRLAAAELKPLLADAEPELLFVDPEFEPAVRDLPPGVAVRSTAGLAWPDPAPPAEPRAPLGPEQPWVLLYTSGTTGRPKAVIVTPRTAFFCAYNFAQVGDLTPAATTLADAPMFHTVGLFAIMHAGLTAGATLLIAERFDPAVTLQRLSDRDLGVTHYFCVPQMAQALLSDPSYPRADLSKLHGFFTGGAPLPGPIADALLDAGVPLSNGYGSSEAGTIMHVPLDHPAPRTKRGSCGVPVAAVEVRLVAADGRDVAGGEVGEIWLRGPAVTPGYWRQPEATASAFRDGWFRTGDAARCDEDGLYTLVDRWKDMYISGGENVYPAEVEAAQLELEGVLEAAVVGAPEPRWGETGHAFIVRAEGAALEEAAVTAFCRERLAGYKRPTVVRFVDALPRTASGKVLKDQLRATAAEPRRS
jgi:fatty-acyl-CoA synthase